MRHAPQAAKTLRRQAWSLHNHYRQANAKTVLVPDIAHHPMPHSPRPHPGYSHTTISTVAPAATAGDGDGEGGKAEGSVTHASAVKLLVEEQFDRRAPTYDEGNSYHPPLAEKLLQIAVLYPGWVRPEGHNLLNYRKPDGWARGWNFIGNIMKRVPGKGDALRLT